MMPVFFNLILLLCSYYCYQAILLRSVRSLTLRSWHLLFPGAGRQKVIINARIG